MTKKGFTLIELLAVIVILAIIALITIPLVYNITKNSRKESYERSVDLYANAIRNGISEYELEGEEYPPGKYSSEDFKSIVNYEGDVECTTIELYEDGKIYLDGCKVNNKKIEYVYGTKQELPSTQVYKPQYYWFDWSFGYTGDDLPSDAKEKVSELDTKGLPYYIGLDVDSNNKISNLYGCFVRNDVEYCLKSSIDGSTYQTNMEIMNDAFNDVADTGACYVLNQEWYVCNDGDLDTTVHSSGSVYVEVNDVPDTQCFAGKLSDGSGSGAIYHSFYCTENY